MIFTFRLSLDDELVGPYTRDRLRYFFYRCCVVGKVIKRKVGIQLKSRLDWLVNMPSIKENRSPKQRREVSSLLGSSQKDSFSGHEGHEHLVRAGLAAVQRDTTKNQAAG